MVRGPTQAKLLGNYIRTKAKPHVFWLPKTQKQGITTVTDPAVEALHEETRKCLEEELAVRLARIEAERAEDVAAEAARQAAFEERQLARQARAEEEKEGGDGGRGKRGDDDDDDEAEEEEEEAKEQEQEIIL